MPNWLGAAGGAVWALRVSRGHAQKLFPLRGDRRARANSNKTVDGVDELIACIHPEK